MRQRKSQWVQEIDLKELEHITILKAVTDHRIGLTLQKVRSNYGR